MFLVIIFVCLLSACGADNNFESKVKFSSGNQSGLLKDDNEINGEDAVGIIKSYSDEELMLSAYKDYSFFISSETAVYENESYYKVVAGAANKNPSGYYNIDEIGCFLVSLNGERVFIFDNKNGSLKLLNTIYDIENYN